MEWLFPILDAVLGSLVRSGLLLLTGFLIERHLVSKDVADRFVADAVQHVLIAVPALVALAWSIWAKVRGRVKLLTALDAPAGTTEEQINCRIENGLGTSVKAVPMAFLALAIAGATLSGCASLPAKQNAVLSLQASETALEAAHDAERLLCSPTADQTQAITHCDGAGAQALGLTDARHQALARVFSKAFGAEAVAANALIVWRAGDPPPSTVADYQKDLDDILALVKQTFPITQVAVTKTQTAVDEAAKIAVVLGVK